MSRKPQIELAGGKSQRQRIWEAIRANGVKPFKVPEVTPCNVPLATARDYLVGLAAAGYLTTEQHGKAPRTPFIYKLARDIGAEAPRVRKNGEEVTQGNGNEALWGAMQALKTFNARVLAKMAGVNESTARSYCAALAQAGYLTVDREGKGMGRGGILATYRLMLSRVKGPRPPMITRLKAVYDPNIHKIVWQQNADDALEESEKLLAGHPAERL